MGRGTRWYYLGGNVGGSGQSEIEARVGPANLVKRGCRYLSK
jgi:hypothetical protein